MARYSVCDWVRAVNPRTLQLETVLVIDFYRGQYRVDNATEDWWTYMVKAPLPAPTRTKRRIK